MELKEHTPHTYRPYTLHMSSEMCYVGKTLKIESDEATEYQIVKEVLP